MSKGKKTFKIVGGFVFAALVLSNLWGWLLDEWPIWAVSVFGVLAMLVVLVYFGVIEYWNYNERTKMLIEQEKKGTLEEEIDETRRGDR